MTLDIPTGTDDILTSDSHLIQSFANLHGLKQQDARTAIVGAKGAMVTDINTDAANEPGVNRIPKAVSADATTDAVWVVLTTVVP